LKRGYKGNLGFEVIGIGILKVGLKAVKAFEEIGRVEK
jgi:hypothetical protein